MTVILILSACSNLSGEPDIARTIEPPTPLPNDIFPPTTPPDLALGRQVFLENCTACHGINGEGDGEFVVSGQITDPGNFRLADANAGQTPLQWYTTITNGNLANLMPPWREEMRNGVLQGLPENERWAVAMYTYTLSYTQDQVISGQAVLAANPTVSDVLASVSNDPAQISNVTDGALRTLIRDANADLSDADVRSAQMAARLSTTQNTDAIFLDNNAIQPEATEEAGVESTPEVSITADRTGTVSGVVTNGTAGSDVPAGTPIIVTVFDQDFNIARFNAVTTDGGNYSVPDIPFSADLFYVTEVDYRERQFYNNYDSSQFTDEVSEIDIPVTIYELTEDPDVITIVGDVMQIRPVANTLEVLHIIRFQNSSDRAFTSQTALDDGRFASLLVSLPIGSIVLGFDSDQRYSVIEEDYSFVDSALVLPGDQHFTTVTYLIPYENDAIIEYPVNYRMEGASRILVNSDEMTLTGDDYESLGDQQIGENTYHVYGADLNLQPSDSVRFEVSGGGTPIGTSADRSVVTADNLAPIIAIIAVGLIILGIGIFFMNRRAPKVPVATKRDNKDRMIDALVRQIAELDAEHEAGQINHDLYHSRRKQLKARLAELMDSEGTG